MDVDQHLNEDDREKLIVKEDGVSDYQNLVEKLQYMLLIDKKLNLDKIFDYENKCAIPQ